MGSLDLPPEGERQEPVAAAPVSARRGIWRPMNPQEAVNRSHTLQNSPVEGAARGGEGRRVRKSSALSSVIILKSL